MSLRFGWIGLTRRTILREKIAACAQAWLSDWQIAHGDAEACVEYAPIVPYSSDEACVLQAGSGQPCLMVVVASDELARLGNWLADIRGSASTLSQDVGRAALDDLADRISLLVGKGKATDHDENAWPRSLTREELGATGLLVEAGGVPINLALSRDAVDALCPPSSPMASPELQTRADAAGTALVRVTAGFEFGSISMRELAELRAGEVLVGECSLDTPIRILAPGNKAVGNARIGRMGNRLAVALTQPSTPQEKT